MRSFPQFRQHRFAEIDQAFGQWEMPGTGTIQYAVDNEIHHRGQGYVYLRASALGRCTSGSIDALSPHNDPRLATKMDCPGPDSGPGKPPILTQPSQSRQHQPAQESKTIDSAARLGESINYSFHAR
jgi:hypothetical protein